MKQKTKLIPVSEFAQTYYSRRGFPVSVQYIYKLISEFKKGIRSDLPFEFEEIGKGIWIISKV